MRASMSRRKNPLDPLRSEGLAVSWRPSFVAAALDMAGSAAACGVCGKEV